MLVTSGGHSYTKRLVTDPSEPDLAQALAATDLGRGQQPGLDAARGGAQRGPQRGVPGAWAASRKLAQVGAAQTSVGIASTDLGCDGCSGYDNRAQVLLPCRMTPLPPAAGGLAEQCFAHSAVRCHSGCTLIFWCNLWQSAWSRMWHQGAATADEAESLNIYSALCFLP